MRSSKCREMIVLPYTTGSCSSRTSVNRQVPTQEMESSESGLARADVAGRRACRSLSSPISVSLPKHGVRECFIFLGSEFGDVLRLGTRCFNMRVLVSFPKEQAIG